MADEPVAAWREPLPARLAAVGPAAPDGGHRAGRGAGVAVVAPVGRDGIDRPAARQRPCGSVTWPATTSSRRDGSSMRCTPRWPTGWSTSKGWTPTSARSWRRPCGSTRALPCNKARRRSFGTRRAECGFRVADIRYRFNQPAEAEAAYKQAVAIQGALAVEYPDRPQYAQAHAGALNSLAILYNSTGRPDQAEASFRQAASIRTS